MLQPALPKELQTEDEEEAETPERADKLDGLLPEETSCWRCLHRGWTGHCCKPWGFLLFISSFVFVQSMLMFGFYPASLSTLQHRYGIKSVAAGVLTSTYDVAGVCTTTFASYRAGIGHTPRHLATSCVVFILGCLIFLLPAWTVGEYLPSLGGSNLCPFGAEAAACDGGIYSYAWLFFLGIAVQAIGSAILYTVGVTQLHRTVDAKPRPTFLGIFYSMGALGPAFGFVLAGVTLRIWVEPGAAPDGIGPDHDKWVGAWWIGYVASALLCVPIAFVLFLFPQFPPNTRHVREQQKQEELELIPVAADEPKEEEVLEGAEKEEEEKLNEEEMLFAAKNDEDELRPIASETLDEAEFADGSTAGHPEAWTVSLKRMCRMVVELSHNKAYVFNLLSAAADSLPIAGFSLFLPKVVESIFGLTAGDASFYVGLAVVPGAAGGIFLGSCILRHFRWELPAIARFTLVNSLVCTCFAVGFFMGCDSTLVAGINEPYLAAETNATHLNLTAACNLDCGCSSDLYEPVCASELTYFSPCFAGCADHSGADFFNCTCLPSSAVASAGRCAKPCHTLVPFMFFIFLMMLLIFVNNVPMITLLLGLVRTEQRSLALSVNQVTYRVFGTIPAPILFGWLIDSACLIWNTSCGESGACFEYDSRKLAPILFFLAIVPKFMNCIFLFFMFRNTKRIAPLSRRGEAELTLQEPGNELEDMDVPLIET